MFRKVNSKVDFPRMEEGVLRFWKERQIFNKSIEAKGKAPHYTFYEGPPTANGSPGVHHVLSRLFKDVICRYKTMRGYHVPRKAGWDTHGLPVELEVEHSLGFTSKAEIEKYGVAQFNQRCRESAFSYIEEWKSMTERIGCWLDMEHPYVTLDNEYIESCWWIIKKLWDRGLIYQGYRVTPHCPRCGTSLSSHEVALGYKDDTEDPSVYIKFRVERGSVGATPLESLLSRFQLKPAYLLAWTTTPWTLPGNTALAVAPDAEYSIMKGESDYLIMASLLVDKVGLEGYHEIRKVKGVDISGVQKGLRYQPLFNPHEFGVERRRFKHYYEESGTWLMALEIEPKDNDLSFPVIDADFVSLDEGTGIVHVAPAFGEVDFEAGEDSGLDFVQPVDLDGKITGSYPFSGKFVKDADPLILADLKSHGLLYRSERIVHTYPFCWRCESPLLYYAKPAWYIRTTSMKDKLLSANAEINWYPDYIKQGRFGDWLKNNVDWAFSRERYWGTPLNIWHCHSCGKYDCIGSIEELKEKCGVAPTHASQIFDKDKLDLHRPYMDEIKFACPKCGGEMQRVPDVIDCWFDSGAMPVAQWHYPFENKDEFEHNFPADFVCEAVDQTRGWFYSLHALATLLFEQPCFKNVICLGHVVDAQGEKMSKSKGNVIDPRTVLSKNGADALRWYMLVSVPAEENHRFSTTMVDEVLRKTLLTLWNTYSFFILYANIDHFVPPPLGHSEASISYHSEEERRPENLTQARLSEGISLTALDNWIISELNRLVVEVTRIMDNYNPTSAAHKIEKFVDDLSNWYVRRSRRRFWKSENDADKLAAYTTLYQCLVTLSQLSAPFVPFIAEELYQNLVCSVDSEAEESVHLTSFPVADETKIDDKLNGDVELARKISSLGRAARAKAKIKIRQPLGKLMVKLSSREEKRALERFTAEVMEEINVKELITLSEAKSAVVLGIEFAKEPAEFPSDVPGYSVASDDRYWVAVDTELTPDLMAEGASREVVRYLQSMRRTAQFDITDHIITYYQAEESVRRVMVDFADYIKQETLSHELIDSFAPDADYIEEHRVSDSNIVLAVKKAT
ncbi:MAG: isoleucine--tRNA ligase [Dehalococcoidia bacterium]|nr:isoleucine--tRNA ligase [Dehalococcoidia bacterium]